MSAHGRNHALDGVEIPHGMGQFWGLSYPLKSNWQSMLWSSVQTGGIIQSSVMACSRRRDHSVRRASRSI